MGEFVIRFDSYTIERLVYWLIIIILASLLIWCYVSDHSDTQTKDTTKDQASNDQVNAAGTNDDTTTVDSEETKEEEEVVDVVDETCSDGIKNQDETGIDCGGICSDIRGEYYYAGKCHTEPEVEEDTSALTGDVKIEVSNIETQKASSDAVKVVSFKVTVTNGKTSRGFYSVEAFAKSTSGTYLNQFGSGDEYSVYMGPLDIGKVESGETVTATLDEAGAYIFEQVGYKLGDDFKLTIRLLDDDGEKVDEVTKTVKA